MTSHYRVVYYLSPSGDNPVADFLDELSDQQQTKVLRIFQYINTYGLIAIQPHTQKLTGMPLWEIRILGKDNIRVVYAIATLTTVLVIHGFIKKSQKTPARELQTALRRYEEWKQRQLLDK